MPRQCIVPSATSNPNWPPNLARRALPLTAAYFRKPFRNDSVMKVFLAMLAKVVMVVIVMAMIKWDGGTPHRLEGRRRRRELHAM